MICDSDLINFLFRTGLTQAKVDWFVGHLFDKNLPTTWPASIPTPFCSENPPPSVSIHVSFGLPYTRN
jgi:hypothetical protein